MISQTAEYAIRALAHMAQEPSRPSTIQQMASNTRIPASYLSKVMQHLVRQGLVSSQRGLGGGFLLARRPDQLTLLDVVKAVDPFRRLCECPAGFEQHKSPLCKLHATLNHAVSEAERILGGTTILGLLDAPPFELPGAGHAHAAPAAPAGPVGQSA